MNKQIIVGFSTRSALAKLAALALVAGAGAANAAADMTPITTAQTDLLAYAAALLALGIAVWAAMKVVRMFGGK